jgi:tetratricopeptide (TPR) repeat protein
VAHEYLAQANAITSEDDNARRMALFDKATLHFANIVVRDDADDTLRADALYTLRWIEAYVRRDYDLALQYLNQYLEIVGPEHESYPTCLAYKADDLWHFGAQHSALYYAYKALSLPHTTNDRIEYICHHVMWNIYESKDMPDSASVHRAMHMKVKGSREFVPLTMNELKNQLKTNVISSSSRRNVALVLVPFLVLLLALVGGVLVLRGKRGKRSSETHSIPSEELTLTSKTEDLSYALNRGLLAFKTTSAYGEISAMKLNERELPLSSSDSVRAIEQSLLESFHDARQILLENTEVNDQGFVCCLCMYLGVPNSIIAHLGFSTTATIRKRKERIRKKLSPEFYEVIAQEKR